MTKDLDRFLRELLANYGSLDKTTVLALIDRAEAAEQALDFHTQRDRELKTLLSTLSDRLDEFSYEELASLIEDEPLNQWSEKYTSKLQAAERERDEWRDKYDEAESARTDTDAAVARVREAHRPVQVEPSETICRTCSTLRGSGENLRYFPYTEYPCPTIRALDGGEQQ